MRILRLLPVLLSICALGGCGSADPEAELRELIAEAEMAAEDRRTGYFRGFISDDYVDRRGRRKDDMINLIRGYFLVNANVEILNRVQEITLHGEDAATVVLQSALLGRAQGQSVLGIDGDLYSVELELVRDGADWRVIGADWERPLN